LAAMKWHVLIPFLFAAALRCDHGGCMQGHSYIDSNVSTTIATKQDGIYVVPDLYPATYRLTIEKDGFCAVRQPVLQLNAQDAVNENFTLLIGQRGDTTSFTVDGVSANFGGAKGWSQRNERWRSRWRAKRTVRVRRSAFRRVQQ
jgi:hypothetical protein